MPQPIFSAPAPKPMAPQSGPELRPMFHAATRIETPDGPRAVETLKPGEEVVINGRQSATVRAVGRVVRRRAEWAYSPTIWPLRVPVGVLGNDCPLRLSAGMHVMLPKAAGFVRLGDLMGIGGIARDRPLADLRYFELHLKAHALVRAEGALCETVAKDADRVDTPLDRAAARRAFATVTGYSGA